MFNVRQYDLPAFVGERTLVIASSYSGNTEETLSAFDQALGIPCKKLAITSGGKLLTTARANGVPTFSYEFKGEPRAAVGWGLMPLLRVGEKLGLMQGVERDIEEMLQVMESLQVEIGVDAPASGNEAKQVTERLREAAGSVRRRAAHRGGAPLEDADQRVLEGLVLLRGAARASPQCDRGL